MAKGVDDSSDGKGGIKATRFIHICEELALPGIAEPLRPTERKVMWTILQLHYGDPSCHFEIQPQPSRQIIELGLHFEGEATLNEQRALVLASGHGHAIASSLGPAWELEEWTGSWRRLHRTWRIAQLTQETVREVAGDLARLVNATGEIVQSMSRRR